MPKRSALSMAFALTTLVTFALVLISVRAGFFGLGGDGSGIQPSAAEAADLGNPQSQSNELSLDAHGASPTPRVTTEYIYYDDGTYGPAPDTWKDAFTNDGGSPADASGDSHEVDGAKQTSEPHASRTPQPFIKHEGPASPTPTATPGLAASPIPGARAPEVTPTPTPKPQVPHQEPTPALTAAPHETEEPQATEAPHETEAPQATDTPHETEAPQVTDAPHATDAPHETPEPRETPEPSETEDPRDD